MDADPKHNDITLNLLVHFICAGTSALILSIAHIHPEYRLISLFALLPFLWRLNRANLLGSILLGVILAVCYIFVAFTGEALKYPVENRPVSDWEHLLWPSAAEGPESCSVTPMENDSFQLFIKKIYSNIK